MLLHVFHLLLRLQLWNIQTNRQYPNCDSIKAFITILFLSTFIKGARQARTLSFSHAFLQRFLIWPSNFKSQMSTAIPSSISSVLDSTEEPPRSAVDGSLQLKRR